MCTLASDSIHAYDECNALGGTIDNNSDAITELTGITPLQTMPFG